MRRQRRNQEDQLADPMMRRTLTTMGTGLFHPDGALATNADLSSTESQFRDWFRQPVTVPMPDGLSYAEWEEWGGHLVRGTSHVGWKLAFWLAFGANRWGETYDKIAEEFQLDKRYLYHLASAGRRFANVSSTTHLTISHARELDHKALPDEEVNVLAKQVVDARLTTAQTRALVREHLKTKSLPKGAPPTTAVQDRGSKRDAGGEREALAPRGKSTTKPSMPFTGIDDVVQRDAERSEVIDTDTDIGDATSRYRTLQMRIAELEARDAELRSLVPVRVSETTFHQMRAIAEADGWGADVAGWLRHRIEEAYKSLGAQGGDEP